MEDDRGSGLNLVSDRLTYHERGNIDIRNRPTRQNRVRCYRNRNLFLLTLGKGGFPACRIGYLVGDIRTGGHTLIVTNSPVYSTCRAAYRDIYTGGITIVGNPDIIGNRIIGIYILVFGSVVISITRRDTIPDLIIHLIGRIDRGRGPYCITLACTRDHRDSDSLSRTAKSGILWSDLHPEITRKS
ncbi:hypothetical protein ES703_80091 [subsurface metagenome]